MKRGVAVLLLLIGLLAGAHFAHAEAQRIEPAYPVPDFVQQLLAVAREELGYSEGAGGYTKYGEWSGDPRAEWCAEFLCWCVAQVDERTGSSLLKQQYPLYSGSNVGRAFFITKGRYVVRNGMLKDWGYQWFKGEDSFLTRNSYIPQPGDWVFFSWLGGYDTDHVAMVEYCTQDENGNVTVHVIEGNNPSAVATNTYALSNTHILGYGTVHDVAEVTMRYGNVGEKVKVLQARLEFLGYLEAETVDGTFGRQTRQAVADYQRDNQLGGNGIADIATQNAIILQCMEVLRASGDAWLVQDE